MDTLRQLSQREGIKAAQKSAPIFHSAFLSSLRRHGRVHEPEMAVVYTLRSGGLNGLKKQAGTGIAMFRRGKIKLLPPRVSAGRQVKNIFKKVKK
jgi:heterodisulfide reductase subunit C